MSFHQLNADRYSKPTTDFSPGPAPQQQWIEIRLLVVDSTYQRGIGRRGSQNIGLIAEHFDWSKFAPVIVAPVEGGLFAIVDGQHRTTAAMLRGLKQVPCHIVQADRAQQAAAYAAVNGAVTQTTPQQLYHAKLAAGDEDALALSTVCSAAAVEILRSNITSGQLKVGQTQAVGALKRCLAAYGRDTLITALQCITQTSDGNAGFVRATIIEGICHALHSRLDWRDAGDELLRAMDKFSFPDMWSEVVGNRDKMFPATALLLVSEIVTKHLSKRLRNLGQKIAA